MAQVRGAPTAETLPAQRLNPVGILRQSLVEILGILMDDHGTGHGVSARWMSVADLERITPLAFAVYPDHVFGQDVAAPHVLAFYPEITQVDDPAVH